MYRNLYMTIGRGHIAFGKPTDTFDLLIFHTIMLCSHCDNN